MILNLSHLNKNMKKKNIIKFLKSGYYIFNIQDKKKLKYLRDSILKETKKITKKKISLEKVHNHIKPKDLNTFKLKIYSSINSNKTFLKEYFEICKNELIELCGNEIAMQRKISLSVQIPGDDSALLPTHSDVWSGCSPFEVVFWLPLVNCKRTNSMFIYEKNKTEKILKNIKNINLDSFNSKDIKKTFLNIKFGQGLIFSHQLLHGNQINNEKTSRWSMNCRFKSLLSPYGKKDIGETFIPLNILPATRLGFQFFENEK